MIDPNISWSECTTIVIRQSLEIALKVENQFSEIKFNLTFVKDSKINTVVFFPLKKYTTNKIRDSRDHHGYSRWKSFNSLPNWTIK